MKLFKTLSAMAVVRAQVPDFSDLNALFASLTENLSVPGAPAEEVDAARYVVATTTATTTPGFTPGTPPQTTTRASSEGCWKCDAMTYSDCATQGYWQECSLDQTEGDYGVCFLELRETNQLMTQLCTGCKSRTACYNLRRQNFVGSTGSNLSRFHDQCKPEFKLQRPNRRYGNQQSVCRTCFKMCPNSGDDATGKKCFGGMEIGTNVDLTDLATADFFQYGTQTQMFTGSERTVWTEQAKAALQTNMVLGIPLGLTCPLVDPNTGLSTTCSGQVSGAGNMVNWGGDRADATHGKDTVAANRGKSHNVMGLYWAIQDQTKTWWEYDHVVIQSLYQDGTADSYVARLQASNQFTGLSDLI